MGVVSSLWSLEAGDPECWCTAEPVPPLQCTVAVYSVYSEGLSQARQAPAEAWALSVSVRGHQQHWSLRDLGTQPWVKTTKWLSSDWRQANSDYSPFMWRWGIDWWVMVCWLMVGLPTLRAQGWWTIDFSQLTNISELLEKLKASRYGLRNFVLKAR